MSGIDRTSSKRDVARDYDAPLPGEARKQANLVANAPWAMDVNRLASTETSYSPAMFANPALTRVQEPPRAAAATASAPTPSARSEDSPRIAPNAYRGIALMRVADVPALPSGGPPLKVGNYKLHPMMAKQPDGSSAIAYYTAYNSVTKKTDFVVGPGSLDAFKTAHPQLENIASLYDQNGWRPYEASSARVVDQLMKHGFDGALEGVLGANKEAVCDPVFWGEQRQEKRGAARLI